MTDETIGQRLRRLREERGVSQRQLGGPGCSPAYISRIEQGDRTPSVKAIRYMAAKLGVSAEYLEAGHDRTTTDELIDRVRERVRMPGGDYPDITVTIGRKVEVRWVRGYDDPEPGSALADAGFCGGWSDERVLSGFDSLTDALYAVLAYEDGVDEDDAHKARVAVEAKRLAWERHRKGRPQKEAVGA